MMSRNVRYVLLALAIAALCAVSPIHARASGQTPASTALTLQRSGPVPLGERASITASLTTLTGEPIANAMLRTTVDGKPGPGAITGEDGEASFSVGPDLAAGTHRLVATYRGSREYAPATASTEVEVSPAELEIHAVPALPGIPFVLNGRRFTTDHNGVARVRVDRPGVYDLTALPVTTSYFSAAFKRWGVEIFEPSRKIRLPVDEPVEVGYDVKYLVGHSFVDLEGKPVAPSRVSSLTVSSSVGGTVTFKSGQPMWLRSGRVVRLRGGLTEKPVLYSIYSVTMNGSNVVYQSKQHFYARPNSEWQIQLLLFSAHFTARDKFFGFPIGTGIELRYPDGHVRYLPFGDNAEVSATSLPRGSYSVSVAGVQGLSPSAPIALSRDQSVELSVISYLDMAVVALVGAMIFFGLLFLGRPQLLTLLLPLRRRRKGAPSHALATAGPQGPAGSIGGEAVPSRSSGSRHQRRAAWKGVVAVALVLTAALTLYGLSGSWKGTGGPATQRDPGGTSAQRVVAPPTSGPKRASKPQDSSPARAPQKTATPNGSGGAAATATRGPQSTATPERTAVRSAGLVPTQAEATPTGIPTGTPTAAPTETPAPTHTATPVPTKTPRPTSTPTKTPVPTATPRPAMARSGIGLSRADWERAHGKAEQNIGGFLTYQRGRYVVAFLDGKVRHVERFWGGRGVPMSVARSESKALLPTDTVMRGRSSLSPDYVTEVYMSAYARKRFSAEQAEMWFDSRPGSLQVLYHLSHGRVVSVIVDAGTIP